MKNIIKATSMIVTITVLIGQLHASQFDQPIDNLNNYNTSCIMHELYAKPSQTMRSIVSDHNFSVTNSSGGTQNYHVEYQNYVLYSGNYYTLISKNAFDVKLNNGESKNVGSSQLSGQALFSVAGTYPTLCKTVITLNGKDVSSGQSKNFAYIG
jgi:hypothetical protein